MPTNYGSRLTITALVLLCCLFGIPGLGDGIFKTGSLFSHLPWKEKLNLHPGIDIAGGTSLTYEIKQSSGGGASSRASGTNGTIAEQVAQALKRRVDPNGVRNLIWRPQGQDRLEIQIPRSGNSEDRSAAQKDWAVARQQLSSTNVSVDDVIHATEMPAGPQRDAQLKQLAGGSASRLKLFQSIAGLHDQSVKAKADLATAKTQDQKDEIAQKAAEAEIELDKLKPQIADTDLSEDDLQLILGLPAEERAKRLDALLQKNADFPDRIAAIKQYTTSYDTIQKSNNSLDDAADLKRLLRGSGVLEFHILPNAGEMQSADALAMIQRLKTEGPGAHTGETLHWYQVDKPAEFQHNQLFSMDGDPDHKYILAWATPGKQLVHNLPGRADWTLSNAFPSRDPSSGDNTVGFEFDSVGAHYFGDLTRNNLGQPLGIVLDNKMISAPNINAEITSSGVITGGQGGFTKEDQDYLADTLKAGSLPASLADEPISERTVSPQLGAGNLTKGLAASGIGVIVVGVFLIGYYYLAGVVAFIAVLMNLIIILGVLAMFGATFTMPSIAGIVLTIGTAVDANVLVFERMREEEHRGFPLKLALQHAYDRALSAIVDSNMTTIITSLCLYFFGSEEVRGFGLTLVIGITSSLFTALFVTKTIFAILINEYGVKELGSIPTSFPKWDKLLKPDIDWMGMIWPFVAFSAVFIIAGMSAFIIHKRNMFDIEFASGTSVQFELTHNMSQQEVLESLSKSPQIPSASVVSLNNRSDFYEVVTPNDKSADVRDAVLATLGTNLKLELPSKFDSSQKVSAINVDSVIGSAVLPIDKQTLTVDGKNVPGIASYNGGAAIVLQNLDPVLTTNEILNRIDRASTAPGSTTNLSKFKMAILPEVGGSFTANRTFAETKVKNAVILVQQPDFLYSKGAEAWRTNVADPMWRLTNEGVGREAKLQKVSNFDPQIAGDTQRQAFLATFLSILAIMVYIWFRFGDMKYATATVVALIHDTLAVVGAVGLSHYLDNAVGHALLVEPFRINLTLVAAILTIMGYSMIDTIVVFDRIRENRGRFGVLTRQVINDSINQTLSRTLLTAGTTLITVTTMYLLGGPAIHGFTFVLLVGILIGTYSSIAIASPILLIGADVVKPAGKDGSGSALGQGRPTGGAGPAPAFAQGRSA